MESKTIKDRAHDVVRQTVVHLIATEQAPEPDAFMVSMGCGPRVDPGLKNSHSVMFSEPAEDLESTIKLKTSVVHFVWLEKGCNPRANGLMNAARKSMRDQRPIHLGLKVLTNWERRRQDESVGRSDLLKSKPGAFTPQAVSWKTFECVIQIHRDRL